MASTEVFTIGHSTRPLVDFVHALTANHIKALVDIRRFPVSGRNPQFNADELKRALHQDGIQYVFLGDELGGFRQHKSGSVHAALRDCNFQAYADHLSSRLYEAGAFRLLDLAQAQRTCIMCSERKTKDCHRKILSDDLVLVRGVTVTHILDADEKRPHEPTSTARVVDGRLVYAAARLDEFSAPSA